MNFLIVSLLFSCCRFRHSATHRKDPNFQRNLELLCIAACRGPRYKLFQEQGLDVEIILMRSAAAVAALVSGDLELSIGIGPASVSATLSSVDSRAPWSSTDRITY